MVNQAEQHHVGQLEWQQLFASLSWMSFFIVAPWDNPLMIPCECSPTNQPLSHHVYVVRHHHLFHKHTNPVPHEFPNLCCILVAFLQIYSMVSCSGIVWSTGTWEGSMITLFPYQQFRVLTSNLPEDSVRPLVDAAESLKSFLQQVTHRFFFLIFVLQRFFDNRSNKFHWFQRYRKICQRDNKNKLKKNVEKRQCRRRSISPANSNRKP